MKLKTIVIGLGHQALEDHIPAIIESDRHNLVAVVDNCADKVNELSSQFKAEGFTSVADLIGNVKVDLAVVAVPHNEYLDIIRQLAEAKIHIIREKPFATNTKEALGIWDCVKSNDVFLGVTLQRRFNPI